MPQCADRYVEVTMTSMEGALMSGPMPTTSFRLPQELLDAAKAKARKAGIALSEVLVRLLGGWVAGVITLPTARTVYELEDPPPQEGPPS